MQFKPLRGKQEADELEGEKILLDADLVITFQLISTWRLISVF